MSIQRPRLSALLSLATDARGEDWSQDLSGAITAATFAGWTWERIFLTAARLIVDPDATPAMLLEAVTAADECWLCAAGRKVAS